MDPVKPEVSEIPVSAEIVWTVGSTVVYPVAVESIRITVTSDCGGSPNIKTFPFTSNEGVVASVKTGCTFDVRCEGLGIYGERLYMGEKNDLLADGEVVRVRITADGCTPVPPDSLKAIPAGRKIKLLWNDRSNNESGFIIKRVLGSSATYVILDTVTAVSYIDTFNIKRNVSYYYEVSSYNAIGISTIPGTATKCSLGTNTRPHFISLSTDMDSIAEVGSIYRDTIRYADADAGDSLYILLDASDTSTAGFAAGIVLKDSILTWTPTVNQEGKSYIIAVIVSDQDLSRAVLRWSVRVKDTVITHLPPVFTTDALALNDAPYLGEQYLDTLVAIDPEHGAVFYSKLEGPVALTVDSLSGIVSWQTDVLGQVLVSAIARDEENLKDTVSWTITVSVQ